MGDSRAPAEAAIVSRGSDGKASLREITEASLSTVGVTEAGRARLKAAGITQGAQVGDIYREGTNLVSQEQYDLIQAERRRGATLEARAAQALASPTLFDLLKNPQQVTAPAGKAMGKR